MFKGFSHSLYEQLIYELITLTQNSSSPRSKKFLNIKNTGITMGKKALITLSKYISYNSYNNLSKIFHFICNEFWQFIFGEIPTDVTSPNPNSISFKNNNFFILKRIDIDENDCDKKEFFFELFKEFVTGLLFGVLGYFEFKPEIRIIYQNSTFFLNIECEDN